MKTEFPHLIQPQPAEQESYLENGIVVPDTNVLLNLYRWSPQTTSHFFDLMEAMKERLWIPHQVAYEFLLARLEVASEQQRVYDEVVTKLESIRKAILSLKIHRHHPVLRADELRAPLLKSVASVERKVKRAQSSHPPVPLDHADHVLGRLFTLTSGRVGSALTESEMAELRVEADGRYKRRIPPGYSDADKSGDGRLGDLIIWTQTIRHAAATKLPIVIVTDDEKEDWWRTTAGRKWGPRHELLAELRAKAGVEMWMYTSDRFMERAAAVLKKRRSEQAVAEAEAARRAHRARIAAALAVQQAAEASDRWRQHAHADRALAATVQAMEEERRRAGDGERARYLLLQHQAAIEAAISGVDHEQLASIASRLEREVNSAASNSHAVRAFLERVGRATLESGPSPWRIAETEAPMQVRPHEGED